MKVLLCGFEGSKRILHASSYLVQKYLLGPSWAEGEEEFEINWLNYGQYQGQLDVGNYISLCEVQDSVRRWAMDLSDYLRTTDDQFIILTLDDYLLSHALNLDRYQELLNRMKSDPKIVCGRLCISDFYQPTEISYNDGVIITLSTQAEYSSTAQYCIWDRAFLLELLNAPHIETPWDFEVRGSQYLNQSGRQVIGHCWRPALDYNCSSSLSSRWKGINISGCNEGDIEYLIQAGALSRKELSNRGEKIHWGTPKAFAEAR
jgi:hypothetical protein